MRKGFFVFAALLAIVVVAPWKAGAAITRVRYASSDSITFKELARRPRMFKHRQSMESGIGDLIRPVGGPVPHLPASAPRPPSVASGPQATASARASASAAPATAGSFHGIADNDTVIPPDTHGAVGPSSILEVTNQEVRVFSKSGNTLISQSLDTWWSGLGASGVFDPRAVYDSSSGRFIFCAISDGGSSASRYLVAVSATSDPTGTWYRRSVIADAGGATWADFPSLGFNATWIAISVNMFSVASGAYQSEDILTIDKANLYANGTQGPVTVHVTDGTFTMVPAETFDSNAPLWFLTESSVSSGGAGYLHVYKMTGSAAAPSLTDTARFPSGSPWAVEPIGGGDFLPQANSSHLISGGDSRVQQAVLRDGHLWAVQSVYLPDFGRPVRESVQWWEIDPTTGITQQFGRVDDPQSSIMYAYPSVAVNTNQDALIGFSRFSSGSYPSAAYAFRYAGDPIDTLQAPVLIKSGEASYYKTFNQAENRWGDYSHTVVDPSNGVDFWTVQTYSRTPSGDDLWGTWWDHLAPGTGPAVTPLVFSPSSLDFGDVQAHTSSTMDVKLTNNGASSVTISSVGSSNSDYVPSGCSGDLAAGASCALTVTFDPSTLGSSDATITLTGPSLTYHAAGRSVDTVPPASSFETQNDSITDPHLLSALNAPDVVTGISKDASSGIATVDVSFRSMTGSVVHRLISRLRCDSAWPRTCGWSAPVPSEPGVYDVTVQATDVAGNTEAPIASIRIFNI